MDIELISDSDQALQKLIILHRRLLEMLGLEREVLVQADIQAIEKVTEAKHVLIQEIQKAETHRLSCIDRLASIWNVPASDLTLSQLIKLAHEKAPEISVSLKTGLTVLTLLVQRIIDQNQDNRLFVEKSLGHLHEMKKNILSEATTKSNTYSAQGKKKNGAHGARLLSKEV